MISIDKIRRKLAGWVLGERYALFVPNGTKIEELDYLALDDTALAAISRRWLLAIRDIEEKLAKEKGLPVSVYTTSASVMNLIQHAREINANTMTITQNGHIRGIDIGTWRLELERLPAGYDFGEQGAQITKDAEGRITHAAYSFTIPK
jgi:hypothetical protein